MTPTCGSRPPAGSSGHWIAWLPPLNKVLINRVKVARTKGHSSISFACCISLWSDEKQLQLISAHFRQRVCVRLPCSLWSVESCQRVCSLISILTEMYMYVHVYVYGCLNISVPVSVRSCVCTCEWPSFCVCVSKGYSDTVKCCPHARQIGLACLGLLRPAPLRSGCAGSTDPVACAACQSGIQDTGGVWLCWCAC